jgi:hypothetical protein
MPNVCIYTDPSSKSNSRRGKSKKQRTGVDVAFGPSNFRSKIGNEVCDILREMDTVRFDLRALELSPLVHFVENIPVFL